MIDPVPRLITPPAISGIVDALVEAGYVAPRGNRFRDFVHLSINTLIGGGLIFDGVLQTGPNGNAAAFGPMPVTHSTLSSIAVPLGPFEILLRRASVYGLINHLRHCRVTIDRVRELDPMPAAAAGPYLEWEKDCADALAQAMISTLAVVDPEAIGIDG